MSDKHVPVMLTEAIGNLDIKADGTYLDCTFGSGGHSWEILRKLGPSGRLIAFDYDRLVSSWASTIIDDRFTLINDNFANFADHLERLQITAVDGFLFDLGLSSMQLEMGRGFSYRDEAILDMRVNPQSELTAAKIINEYSAQELADIFFFFGEERKSYKLANAIYNYTNKREITTSEELAKLVTGILGKNKNKQHPAKKVFQALRIAVNNELGNLTNALTDCYTKLARDGRIVVISYHSLEDRITKQSFRAVVSEKSGFKLIHKKPLVPSATEVVDNHRARSAKLRVLVRNSLVEN